MVNYISLVGAYGIKGGGRVWDVIGTEFRRTAQLSAKTILRIAILGDLIDSYDILDVYLTHDQSAMYSISDAAARAGRYEHPMLLLYCCL